MKDRTPQIVLLATLFALLSFGSCKKEAIVVDNDSNKMNEIQSENTLERIKAFKRKVEHYRAYPSHRDAASVTLDEALWNIEALFNVTYAYPELAYTHMEVCDTILYLEMVADNTVSMSKLAAFYDGMYEAVSILYHGVELDNKQFLILDVEEGEKQDNMVAVRLHCVQGSVKKKETPPDIPDVGPFENGILWYYGENGGNSIGYQGQKDAADTLAALLNAHLVSTAPEGYEYIYTNTVLKETPDDTHYLYPYGGFPNVTPRYCEFYKVNPIESDYWLDSDRMNFHYFGERHLILVVFPNSPEYPIVPLGHSLVQVVIEDYILWVDPQQKVIGHHTKALYGRRELVGQGIVDRGEL